MTLLPYRPHILLRNGHLQTLMVGLNCGWRPSYDADLIEVEVPDGERLAVHQERTGALPEDAPTTILIHGLGGDHSSPYLQRIAHRLAQAGQRAWRVDLRGCGAGIKLGWRPPHAGRSDDIAAVIQEARKRYPQSPIKVVGFSLSGNILLKMLGEVGQGTSVVSHDEIDSAIAIAPPIELGKCADRIDRLDNRFYTKYYLKVLGGQVEQRRQAWTQWAKVPTTPLPKTIRQFDARYTVPLSGLSSTDNYYSSCSALPVVRHIKTPTTILADQTDPIVAPDSFHALPPDHPKVKVVTTKHGGHMGYWGRDDAGKTVRWMELFVQHQLLGC